jgi:HlyD family secretion protein
MRQPRFRFTIRRLMIIVVVASLLLTLVVVERNRRLRLIALQRALAVYQNATLVRETTEIAMVEYTQGIYMQDQATVKTEIALAESDLQRARARLDRSRSMLLEPDDEPLRRSKAALERAKQKLVTLETSTKAKTIKELQSEVDKAKADEEAKKFEYDRLKAAVARQWW